MTTGYEFVPFPPQVRRVDRSATCTLDRRIDGCWFGKISVNYRAEQPIHVGSGAKVLRDGKVYRAATRAGGRPVIPGSSFKGALRSRYEAITLSCALWRPRSHDGRLVSRSRPDVREAEIRPAVLQAPVFRACQAPGLCPACALFGVMGQRGRVTVVDVVPVAPVDLALGELPPQFGPRLHHLGPAEVVERNGVKKFVVTALHGRKFGLGRGPVEPGAKMQGVEVLPVNTELRAELRLFNVTSAELGGLLCALGLAPASPMKVGAGKGLEHGRLRPLAAEYSLTDARLETRPHDVEAWQKAFEESEDRFAEGQARLVAIHKAERVR